MTKDNNKTNTASRADGLVRADSASRALSIIGNAWSMLLVKEAFLGTTRFSNFMKRLQIPRQTLMLRLAELVDYQILYKQPIQGQNFLYEYKLTPKGLDFYPFILSIWRWHHRRTRASPLLPANLIHKVCGHAFNPEPSCDSCGGYIEHGCVSMIPGSGAGLESKSPVRGKRLSSAALSTPDHSPVELLQNITTHLVSDRWCNLILLAIHRDVLTYKGLRDDLGISSNILSNRLKKLVKFDLLRPLKGSSLRNYGYELTKRGKDLFPLLLSLIRLGDRWFAGVKGPPDICIHDPCGNILVLTYVCSHCGEVLWPWDVRFSD